MSCPRDRPVPYTAAAQFWGHRQEGGHRPGPQGSVAVQGMPFHSPHPGSPHPHPWGGGAFLWLLEALTGATVSYTLSSIASSIHSLSKHLHLLCVSIGSVLGTGMQC